MTGIKKLKQSIADGFGVVITKLNELFNTKEELSNKQQDLLSTDPEHYPSVPAINFALNQILQTTAGVLIYDTYDEMLLDSSNQKETDLLFVKDATADPLLDFDAGENRRWALYKYNLSIYQLISAPYSTISGFNRNYIGATPSTKTIENIPAGTDLSVYTLDDLLENIYAPYLYPEITTFTISQNDVEVGTSINGHRTFTYGFKNAFNVEPNSIQIRDETQNVNLASGLSVTPGTVSLDIGMLVNNTPTTHEWKVSALNTKGETISKIATVNWNYMYFFGGSNSDISTSNQVRGLPTQGYDNVTTKEFEVVLGTGHTSFYLFVPATRKLKTATDRQAANADVTLNYELVGTVNVQDAGGANVPYKKYRYKISNFYVQPHTHDITIINE